MRALLCKIVMMLVQEVSFSKLGLQLRRSEERTQLISNKSPETTILCSSDASAPDLALSCLSFSSKMLEDVLGHKVEHMRSRQGFLIRYCWLSKLQNNIRTRVHDETS
jgi:hypothetical protein